MRIWFEYWFRYTFSMELRSIRSGTKEALESKQYNIGVGISLGNKWFTVENILGLVKWSLKYTNEYIVVYVADSIHAINIEVRERRSPRSAAQKALKLGDNILAQVREAVHLEFGVQDCSRIFYAKWEGLLTKDYNKKMEYLYNEYKNNTEFKGAIVSLVKGLVRGENRQFSEVDEVRLGCYLIEELPELLCRTPIAGIAFEAYVYPYDGEFLEFVEKLQSGHLFS